jgi:hypothetical protein
LLLLRLTEDEEEGGVLWILWESVGKVSPPVSSAPEEPQRRDRGQEEEKEGAEEGLSPPAPSHSQCEYAHHAYSQELVH